MGGVGAPDPTNGETSSPLPGPASSPPLFFIYMQPSFLKTWVATKYMYMYMYVCVLWVVGEGGAVALVHVHCTMHNFISVSMCVQFCRICDFWELQILGVEA